ncbi:UNVERIFIED_CONTAM: hypothetical protein GTU68_024850 [Idotea baltica]|nr:hypothetical protein [Idotea baltica]
MDTSDTWITERTGISERRFVEDGTPSSELGYLAARKALDKLENSEIDLIIAATLSPDYYFPGIGTIIQKKLGLNNIPALDIRAQCSGLVYGLSCADAYIRSGQAKRVLLVCAEVQSQVLELNNRGRDMAVLFGDGAGALVIEASEQEGIIDSLLGSDGSGAEDLYMKGPGSASVGFINEVAFREGEYHPKMQGRHVFKNAVGRMCETAITILKRNELSASDIDLLIPHQANLRINEAVRNHLEIPESSVFNNIHHYGNTTAATIPICMSEAEAAGRLKKGSLVLTLAFGAGYTWGANLVRW